MTKNAKKNLLYILMIVLLLAITLLVLWKSTEEIDYNDVWKFFKECNYVYLIPAFACMFGFILFEGLAIAAILKSIGYRPKFLSSMVYSTSDIYYSAITPSASGGQPASAAFMIRDHIAAGETSFSLLFNLIAYTSSIVLIGLVVLVTNFSTFWNFEVFVKVLIGVGFAVQIALVVFFICCLRWKSGVLRLGRFIIKICVKLHFMKHPEKWEGKLVEEVEKYGAGGKKIMEHKWLFALVFLLNLFQRTCHILIPCFVMLAGGAKTDQFWQLFSMQTFVLVGYNTIPLPGGVGAFEYLYMRVYSCLSFTEPFILAAMMISRVISYYICFIFSGIYTGIYHIVSKKKNIVIKKA